ncbi:MAG: hypothetical protein MJH13_03040 [Shewanella sp.]|nr:hypothetical protein [Shewanella sp.]
MAIQEGLRDQEGNPVQYNFSALEQADLVAFLHTLTDESVLIPIGINYEKFSDPFSITIR